MSEKMKALWLTMKQVQWLYDELTYADDPEKADPIIEKLDYIITGGVTSFSLTKNDPSFKDAIDEQAVEG